MAGSRKTVRLAVDVGTANNLFGLRFVYKSARVSESEWHIHTEPEMGDTRSLRCTNEEMEPLGACIVDFRGDLNFCRLVTPQFEEKQRHRGGAVQVQSERPESSCGGRLQEVAIPLIAHIPGLAGARQRILAAPVREPGEARVAKQRDV
ncbi:hypothetical protein K0M31_018280 [Melipona bicolor]|uniref:Uncharacterized protein n=1 Tax=Melipona bicolor TaxID=60889 RepID=A0AA40FCP7_9HYME|nr:hypothetical protein K0M31_018280 [Melipona bicolor]